MTYEPPAGVLIGPETMKTTKEGDRIEHFMPETFDEIQELGRGRKGPGLVPLGIVRSDPESHYTFQQIKKVWIDPEIERRVRGGVPRESLTPIRQALIVFPPCDAPERHRVLLNEEVSVRAAVITSYHRKMTEADIGKEMDISLRDMFDMRGFALEGVDMQADGFAWMRPERTGWALYFNFVPTSGLTSTYNEADRVELMRSVQDAVAQEMLRVFMHGVFTDDKIVREAMAADGWCPTPILLPEPWRQMCQAYARGDAVGATARAIAAVGRNELDTMLESWVSAEPFKSDQRFLETGIRHYNQGDYLSAVSVLLPRIEGLANRVRANRGIGARESISLVFKSLDQLASADLRDGLVATRIREEFKALIANFLLVHFRPTAPGADTVRGRHAHAHGATADPQYDQSYALKIILAIDALHFIAR